MWRWRKLSATEPGTSKDVIKQFITRSETDETEAIVREVMQNTLDSNSKSKNNDKPAIIKFNYLSGIDRNFAEKIISDGDSLKNHMEIIEQNESKIDFLKKKGSYVPSQRIDQWLDKNKDLGMTIDALVIQDFNTTGLKGNYEEPFTVKKTEPNWRSFWFELASSEKPPDEGGSWGIGKVSFAGVSELSTYFGLTVREDDEEKNRLLLGTCKLTDHQDLKTGDRYDYEAFYRPNENNLLPYVDNNKEHKDLIDEFVEKFQITRDKEPGLTLVIPYPKEGISINSIIVAVIKQHFFAVIQKKIRVEAGSEIIDHSTINEYLNKYEESGKYFKNDEFKILKQEIEFCKNLGKNSYKIETPSEDYQLNKIQLNDIKSRFENDETITIKKKIEIAKLNEEPKECNYEIHFKKMVGIEAYKESFLRGFYLIKNKLSKANFKQLGIIKTDIDKDLGQFIRNAEDPHHDNLESKYLKEIYDKHHKKLMKIATSIKAVLQAMHRERSLLSKDVLKEDFGYVKKGKGNGPRPPKPKRYWPAAGSPIRDKRKNEYGFKLFASKDINKFTFPLNIRITFAYNNGSSIGSVMQNPDIMEYMKERSSDYHFEGKGIQDIKYDIETNTLSAKVEKKDFEIKGIGFNSDLVLDVELKEPSLLIKKREKPTETKLDVEETKL